MSVRDSLSVELASIVLYEEQEAFLRDVVYNFSFLRLFIRGAILSLVARRVFVGHIDLAGTRACSQLAILFSAALGSPTSRGAGRLCAASCRWRTKKSIVPLLPVLGSPGVHIRYWGL